MADIKLVDVSIRDGNQSLWGATGMNTGQSLEVAPMLNRVGFRACDFTSSTHMGIAVRTHKENPWERIRLMHAAMPDTPLQFISTGFRFISWEISDEDFMRLAYRRLMINGIGRFALIDPMHDMTGLKRAARMVKEEGGAEVLAGLTYTVSDVHDDAFYAACARQIASSPHVDQVYLKDPAGLMTPERARTLIPAVQKEIGDLPLELHSHTTIGLASLTALAAAEFGIDAIHVGIGPLAGGTAHPDAARLVANLRELGHRVDIDDHALAQVEDYFTRLAEAEGLPAGTPQEFDAAFLRHQMPGGVVTTMKRQLTELKMEDRWPAVVEEVPRVRAELGYPIMVTPFPQIVCTQALFNVIGNERYGNVPDQVIRYVIGKFGRPTAPIAENIKDHILALPRTKEITAEPPPPSLKERRKQFDPGLSDEEFILRAVMPADQVDAMLAAGPAKRRYNPDSRPLIDLLRELTERPAVSQVVIEKPDFKLELRSRKAADAASADV
jgi:oxaloacetate decarboxylase alpha subunit